MDGTKSRSNMIRGKFQSEHIEPSVAKKGYSTRISNIVRRCANRLKWNLRQTLHIIAEPINIVLIASAFVLAGIYWFSKEEREHLMVSIFTFVIMGFNILVEIYSHNKLERLLDENFIQSQYQVQSGEEMQLVNKEDLAVGDLLLLSQGDTCPADCIVVSSENLQIDESQFTGHHHLVSAEKLQENGSTQILESHFIASGKAVAKIFALGADTTISKASEAARQMRNAETRLGRSLTVFFWGSFVFATALAALCLFFGVIFGVHFFTLADITVSIFIAVLPEGIPAAVKLLLFQTAFKLKEQGLVANELESIEALGEITALCITKNALVHDGRLECSCISDGFRLFNIDFIVSDENTYEQLLLRKVGEIAYRMSLYRSIGLENNRLYSLMLFGKECQEYYGYSNRETVPYNKYDEQKIYGVATQTPKYKTVYFAAMSHEIIMQCKSILYGERILRTKRKTLEQLYENACEHAASGYKTIVLLEKRAALHDEKDVTLSKFTFVSILYFTAELKNGATVLSTVLNKAGISVCLTGDSEAQRLRRVGQKFFTGKNITDNNRDSEDALLFAEPPGAVRAHSNLIIAKCSAEDRYRIVHDLKSQGEIVAFVGADMTDCKALAEANIGICFESAPQRCQELSSFVIREMRPISILNAIFEGRLFLINLKKAIRFIMMDITPQLAGVFFFIFLGSPIPSSPILLIFMNYLIEILPATFFAFEEPESSIVQNSRTHRNRQNTPISEAQQDPNQDFFHYLARQSNSVFSGSLYSKKMLLSSLVEVGLITTIGCTLSFYYVFLKHGIPLNKLFFVTNDYFKHHAKELVLENRNILDENEQLSILYEARCTFFIGLLLCQLSNLLVCRKSTEYFYLNLLRSKRLFFSMVGGIIVSTAVLYTPFFEEFIMVRRPDLSALVPSLGAAVAILVFDTARKYKRNAAI
ncbi:sodium/potassium-transporting ATPase subunit alpha [Enteropsectra breve]|nr:sodium/potassium-transporting ATPase subunit alpha [Enteropsectra breve]